MKHSLVRLGDICTVVSGSTPKSGISDYWDGDVVWITPAELTEDSYIINDSVRHITQKAVQETSLKPFPAGTVILSSRAPIGKTAIAGREMYCNQGFKNLICSSRVNNKYLYFFLSCKTEYLNSLGRGATFKEISKTIVENIEIPLPGIPEQKRIATEFEHIQGLEQGFQKQVSFFDQLVKSRFVEMFGDPKLNPNDYPVCPLSEYIDFLTSGSRGWAQYCTDNGTEWFVTIKNVKDCRISVNNMQSVNAPNNAEARRTKVQEGDLLISITADLGRTGVVTKEIAEHGAYINQHLTCIRLNQTMLHPLYVAHFMESPAGKEQFETKNQSSVKAGLNFDSINSLRIMVPPIDKQNLFAAFVAQVDKSKFSCRRAGKVANFALKCIMEDVYGVMDG
ncbi:MAG TPA: restriction endonuclease subunit S [Candidatus Pullichristensenella stercorigallinarum]|uniref:Restriction endonuclease subunit S n=1 Tax=Candidatus Pullichristensenella stercorigallinarum TaxID=2840909 RepID=A0A9D0ZKC7_9FIRM|nr:restriction endonuclease subunit S [Candidatus Pullichristensenella stercorigallinarum]